VVQKYVILIKEIDIKQPQKTSKFVTKHKITPQNTSKSTFLC